MTRSMLAAVSITLALALPPASATWPQWRGPNRDGVAPNAKLPAKWPAEPPAARWKVPVGVGYAGPVVAGGKVFALGRDDQGNERCLCFGADTGKELWKVEYPESFQPPDPTAGKGPNSTPTVDRDRVYTLGLGGMLHCIEIATGKVLWKHDCRKEFWGVVKNEKLGDDAWFPPCGCATGPLVDGDTVVVAVGGKKAGAFTAFDRATGNIVWKALEDRSSYASPLIASPGGVKQMIGFTGTRMVGLRHADRTLLWDVPFKALYDQTIVTPVVWKDLVVISGEARPTTAWRLVNSGDGVRKEEAWKSDDLKSYLTTPVVVGDHLVGHDMRTGKLACVKLETGETAWTSPRVPGKCHSLVVAGTAVLVLNSEGELFVFRASPEEYEQLAKWKVSDTGSWSHLAVDGNRLYVKDKDTLYCYEL
jgi:outer membrane protein assembly factor BamB